MCQFELQRIAQTLKLVPKTSVTFGGSVMSILARKLTYVYIMNSRSLSNYTLQFYRAIQTLDDPQQVPKHSFRVNVGDVTYVTVVTTDLREFLGIVQLSTLGTTLLRCPEYA